MMRNSLLKTILITSSFILITFSAFGQVNQTAIPALRVEPDPVSTGRGFTGVAQADQASAVFWNPAGLGFQRGLQLGASRFKWLPGLDNELSYNYLMGRYAIDGIGTVGGHITYLDLGSQSFRDAQENSSGNFSSYEFSMGASIGREIIPEKLALGVGFRFVSSRLVPSGLQVGSYQTQAGNSFGVDMGALFKPREYTVAGFRSAPSVGLSITNFGGRVSYSSSGYKNALPSLLRLGINNKVFLDPEGIHTLAVSAEASKLLVRSDSTGAEPAFQSLFSSWGSYEYFNGQRTETVTPAEQLMYGLGLEYWYNDLLAVRTGYYRENPNNGGREFLTFGGSLKYRSLQINSSIAFQQGNSAINSIVRVGLLVNLGGTAKKPAPAPAPKPIVTTSTEQPDPPKIKVQSLDSDQDNDGIVGAEDRCPAIAGVARFNGCVDSDRDGIADPDDRCPKVAGRANTQGCPDIDQDGIADHEDMCHLRRGTEAKNGCPEMDIEFTDVKFPFDSAELQSQFEPELNRLANVLIKYPKTTVMLRGYADEFGPEPYNQQLSERRASTVRKYLLDKGVDPQQIKTTGYGEKPLGDTNIQVRKTRHVEIWILN